MEALPFLAVLLSICILVFIGANNDWFVNTGALPGQAGRNNLTPWQLVTVEDVGSFYVPGNWVITQQGDVIYMTDKPIDEEGYITYFAGVVYDKGQTTERDDTLHDMLGAYTYLSSHYYLAEPNYGPKIWSRDTFKIDGVVVERFVIELEDNRCLYMIAWDGVTSVTIVRRMVISFSPWEDNS